MREIINISDYLLQHDIKPSYQRMKIFEYLVTHRTHPSVDVIYKELVEGIPTLSKTTVYNTVKLFTEKGIVVHIQIDKNESRFDADMDSHGHFICDSCGDIFDFDIDISTINLTHIAQNNIKEYQFYFKGTCLSCKNKLTTN